ncbi:MAG: hypothetical protein ACQESF_01035 [Nanobdellota archaeon]
MKRRFHFFAVICTFILLALLIFLVRIENEKISIDNYKSHYSKYNNYTSQMNDLMNKYNQNSTLSVERVHIISDYLDIYDKRKKNILNFENFVRKENETLSDSGVDASSILKNLKKQKSLIDSNIEGFKKDLLRLNDSLLISYTAKQRNAYENLVERIKDY